MTDKKVVPEKKVVYIVKKPFLNWIWKLTLIGIVFISGMYIAENSTYEKGAFTIHGYQLAMTENGVRFNKTPIQQARDIAAAVLPSIKKEALAAIPEQEAIVAIPEQEAIVAIPDESKPSNVAQVINDLKQGPNLEVDVWEMPQVVNPDPTISVKDLLSLLSTDESKD